METKNQNKTTALVALNEARETFAVTMREAQNLDIVSNVAGAFDAAILVNKMEAVMTDDVMNAVFMPLQGKKIGFKTDKIYPVDVVRTCIIDAAAYGLLSTGNQFNIIAGSMYPTKEGFTALLAKLKTTDLRLVYSFSFDPEAPTKSSDASYMVIPCRIAYKTAREDLNGIFKYPAFVKSNGATSTTDQLRGKAERKCKKAFYEFITGLDLGEGDADEVQDAVVIDVTGEEQVKADVQQEAETAPSFADTDAQEARTEGRDLGGGMAANENFDGGSTSQRRKPSFA